ncbi:hypothetical protein BS47DRAFT_1357488 [Hydnum rufescens UP504]|uniref:Uncharacterized protein n=1 Tax=Hydnum rufescens UP504 TaxID=1448309 RepID=A0A9P6BAF8_9AGAM|nr:hypothetical protein BS47DRAFT_1357488 [Hydnum rufescens UP504]
MYQIPPRPESPGSLPPLRSHHSNTRSTKALASKSRTKAPPKIGPKSRTSSESDEEDADPPTTLKDPKSRARIGAGPAVPQGESSVSQGAGSDTQSRDGADDDATRRPSRLVVEIDSRSTRPSNPNSHVSVGSKVLLISRRRAESQSTQAHGFSPPPSSSRTSPSPPVLLPQSPPLPSFSSPRLTTQTALDNTRNMDPDHVDDNEGMHLGGRFSAEQVAWAQNRCIEFLADLDAKAKEWKRSPESVRRIALAAAPSKFQRNGNAWNAFQSSYRQSNPNLDSSVSASEYTSNVVRPAYLKLIESFGGEDSDTWAAEATRLIAEHDGVKAAAAKQIAQSGGDIARIMSAQKEKWQHMMIAHGLPCTDGWHAMFHYGFSARPYAWNFRVFPWHELAVKDLSSTNSYSGIFGPMPSSKLHVLSIGDHYANVTFEGPYTRASGYNPGGGRGLGMLPPRKVAGGELRVVWLLSGRNAGDSLVDGGVTKKIRELSFRS